MTRRDMLNETLSAMHAADDTYERVLARAQGGRHRRRGRAMPVAAAAGLGLVGVLAVTGTAGAIVTADPLFFLHAWSGHDQGASSTWTVTNSFDNPIYDVTQSYEGVNAEEASRDMASAVQGVGVSCELYGNTLTIDSMVIDSNACGATTFTLSSPDGLSLDDRYGFPGELVLNSDGDGDQLDGVGMRFGELGEDLADVRVFYDADSSTPTELHGTIYFSAWGRLDDALAGVLWDLGGHEGEGDTQVNTGSMTPAFSPSKVVDAKEFTDDAGNVVALSPLSLKLTVTSLGDGFCERRVVLNLADGTEYVVDGEADDGSRIYNLYFSTGNKDGSTSQVFSGLVDVSQVESVTVTGHGDYPDDDLVTLTFTA